MPRPLRVATQPRRWRTAQRMDRSSGMLAGGRLCNPLLPAAPSSSVKPGQFPPRALALSCPQMAEGTEFGFVPKQVIRDLQDIGNWKARKTPRMH